MAHDDGADVRKHDALWVKFVLRRLNDRRREGVINGQRFLVAAGRLEHGGKGQIAGYARHAGRNFPVAIDRAIEVAVQGHQPGIKPEIKARRFIIVFRSARQPKIGPRAGSIVSRRAVECEIGVVKAVFFPLGLSHAGQKGKVTRRIAGFQGVQRLAIGCRLTVKRANRGGQRCPRKCDPGRFGFGNRRRRCLSGR